MRTIQRSYASPEATTKGKSVSKEYLELMEELRLAVMDKDASTAMIAFTKLNFKGEADTESYNLLIKSCIYGSRPSLNAMRCYNGMKQHNIHPNMDTYNYLIEALIKDGKEKDVFQLLKEMDNLGYTANTKTFTVIIKNLLEQDKHTSALSILNSIKNSNPPQELYLQFVNYYIHKDDSKSMMDIIKNMSNRGISVTVSTFNSILELLIRNGKSEEAHSFFNNLPIRVTPNSRTFFLLINDKVEQKKYEEALEILDICMKRGINPDQQIYDMIIRIKAEQSEDPLKELISYLEEKRKTESVEHITCISSSIIRTLYRMNLYSEALSIYTKISDEYSIGIEGYNTIILSMINSGLIEEGKSLFYEVRRTRKSEMNLDTYSTVANQLTKQERAELLEEVKDLFNATVLSEKTQTLTMSNYAAILQIFSTEPSRKKRYALVQSLVREIENNNYDSNTMFEMAFKNIDQEKSPLQKVIPYVLIASFMLSVFFIKFN
eukprot:TRINITY_DN13464_c0_g1_i1.p1 TRINITY_DN13464_c0_g1~~TRINITY_DN13464_c0_g1_i1.p1  ORF type:complete len:532 (-),score=93.53 TRINITY_DN13464_c0_g1_i1:43-1518(-)